MNIFLTGGSGFIGKNLVPRLLEDGHKLTCLVRPQSSISHLKNTKLVYGDLFNLAEVPKISVVIHIAGIKGSPELSRKDYFRTHVEGTRNIVRASAKQKLIYISSAGVLGPVIDADEYAPFNPTNDYEKSKADAERIARGHPNHVILRPEFLYGPHDYHVLQLFEAIRDKRFAPIGSGRSLLHPTYIDDLVSAITICLNTFIKNETFNVAGERPISVSQFHSLVAGKLSAGRLPFKIPRPIALAATLLPSPINKSRYNFFTQSRTFNTGKIESLGYRPAILSEGIGKTIKWYKGQGLL